tara:strand:- start:288 stop:725 length:438 start_codon:yes stop_codon:yes gene_type:complete
MNTIRKNWYKATMRLPLVGHVPLRKALPNTLGTVSDRRKAITAANEKSRRFAFLKPQRMLGAVWMDRFVSSRQGVNLCDICARKYMDWWKHNGYRPDVNPLGAKRGSCDGACNAHLVRLIPFYPEESFEKLRLKPDPKNIIKGVS